MRLKRLEIYGFKSFADRTVIEFDEGITGIVGPNGSGKSNLSDAVRWVLGEQSAKSLRGGKMEDVIFNGTQKRKRLGYCEVSLVFDNSDHVLAIDYAEVMITRRAYRSGDGEYYINKMACRLKDILELFRDTGIGRDGYSIIGQGRIDEILSQKSEDRRAVFEEAAGIVKYRTRKEESEKRLASVRDNLVRIEDIIGELEGQLEPLEKASRTARHYLSLRDELRGLECTSFVLRQDRDTERLEALSVQHRELTEQVEGETQEADALSAERENATQQAAQLESAVTEGHGAVLDLTREAEAREGAIGVLRTELGNMERETASIQESIHQAQARMVQIEEEQRKARKAAEGDAAKLSALRETIEAKEAAQLAAGDDVERAQQALDAHQDEVIRSLNRLSDVRSNEARLSAMRENLLRRSEEAEAQAARVEEDLASIAEQQEEARRAAQALTEQIRARVAKASEANQALAEASGRIGSLYKRLDELNAATSAADSRLRVLREMARDYAGYQQSVKRVLQYAKGDARVHGVVATLIRAPKELERAIEAVLGGALQNVVTSDEYAARDMIAYLRSNNLGRATFLPLTTVKGRTLSREERSVLSMPGCIGVLSELVAFDEPYRGIVENLMGRTLVANDLDAGIEIMRRGRHAFRLVTLAGDVMHSGGSMTGGSSASRMTSILSRDREIAEHEKRLQALQADIADAQQAIRDEKAARDALSAEAQTARDEEARLRIDLSIQEERLKTLERHAKEQEDAAEAARQLRRQIEQNLADIAAQLAGTQSEQAGEQRSKEEMARLTQELTDALSAARDALEAKRSELESLRIAETSARKDEQEQRRALQRLEEERLSQTNRVAESEERLEALTRSHQRKTEELALSEREREACQARLGAAQKELEARRLRRQEMTRAVETLTERIDALRASIASASDQAHRIDMLESRLRQELEQVTQRIWDEYELSYAGAKAYCLPDWAPAEGEARIGAIRREIRAIGPVNLSATEDYRLCRERYDQLTRQRDDLTQAQDDLNGIIAGLVQQMERQFRESLSLLQTYLSESFRKLFNGGSAELRLSDERDALGSGIEIAAQPPGKKLQMLSLLSGGERALTAIAILFAMLRLKPTPFCFLDEIEAALDDGNISTFAEYLKEFAEQTQFVIVTHRKGTMEHCDSLYGVSMEEQGVSRMLSVELKDVSPEMAE